VWCLRDANGYQERVRRSDRLEVDVEIFPRIEGEDLEGRAIEVPEGLPPYPVVLLVAFHRHHYRVVATWHEEIRALSTPGPTPEVFEVAAMPKLYSSSKDLIDGGMRSAVADPEARSHTLSVYMDVGEFARSLGLRSLDTAYVYLTGSDGRIRWSEEGEPDPTKLADLERVLSEPDTSSEGV
jgi:hypothetical protein